jgi:hypothetical protein
MEAIMRVGGIARASVIAPDLHGPLRTYTGRSVDRSASELGESQRPSPTACPVAAEHLSIASLARAMRADQAGMRRIVLRALGAVVTAGYLVVYLSITLAARTALDITPR